MIKVEEFEAWFDTLPQGCQDRIIFILLEKKWGRFVEYMKSKDCFFEEPECKEE